MKKKYGVGAIVGRECELQVEIERKVDDAIWDEIDSKNINFANLEVEDGSK